MSNESAIGAFLEGIGSGARAKSIMDRRDARSKLDDMPLPEPTQTASLGPSNLDQGTGARATSMLSSDPVATDLAPHQRAFLNAIADGESAGKYNIRYTPKGGAEFSDLSRHPGIFEPGPEGPSSAAGRYQFTKTTWDRLGGGDFSPENQDRRAWSLATQDYKAHTGRDLDQDLRNDGLTPRVLKVLQPTWASFGSNSTSRINAYDSSLRRYMGDPATPSKSIAPKEAETPKKSGAISIMSELFPTPRSVLDMG